MSWFEDISGWFNNISDSVGSVFDFGGTSGGANTSTSTGTVVANSQNANEGNGMWSNTLMQSVLGGGLGMAKEYFTASQNKRLMEEYAKQKQAEHEFEMKKADKANAAMLAAARMNNLQQLYSNYMNVAQRGGNDFAQNSIMAGRAATDPITTRAARLGT